MNLCSQKARNMGVISHKKLNKREDNKKMKQTFFHYQDFDKVVFKDTKFSKKGFDKGDHNGRIAHYTFCFHTDLGLGCCDAQRIPCTCKRCLDRLELPLGKAKLTKIKIDINKMLTVLTGKCLRS